MAGFRDPGFKSFASMSLRFGEKVGYLSILASPHIPDKRMSSLGRVPSSRSLIRLRNTMSVWNFVWGRCPAYHILSRYSQ